MPMYILRDIDAGLWERFKARAKADEMPMKGIILKLVDMYASGKISIGARRTPPPKQE